MWTTKLMVDGVWRGDIEETPDIAAKRAAQAGGFRGSVTAGSAPGRYHLYVSYACPFAHRAILVHALKRLDGIVGLSVLHPRWNTADGWVFGDGDMSTPDRAGNGFTHLHQAFSAARPDYTGRVTVPVLWDRQERRIVSDDSRAIAIVLNESFDPLGAARGVDLYPAALRPAIDPLVALIADAVATGAYRIGGAVDAGSYERAQARFFDVLAQLDVRLATGGPYLHGDRLTLSDIVLLTPLVRLEPVYRPLFRATRATLDCYPSLRRWLARLLDDEVIAATVKLDHIRAHYYDGWAPRVRQIVPTGEETR